MANKVIVLGKRKKTPIGEPIALIVVCYLGLSLSTLLLLFVPVEPELIVCMIILCLCLALFIVDLVTRCKTRKNTMPLAKFTKESEEIEFYSILATSLKIKKDKIYMIKAKSSGQIQVFFYSDINQKLVFNCGFFFDAKECKKEIKTYLKQNIK